MTTRSCCTPFWTPCGRESSRSSTASSWACGIGLATNRPPTTCLTTRIGSCWSTPTAPETGLPKGQWCAWERGVFDRSVVDLDELAMALADREFEHRWLIDPRTGGIALWTENGRTAASTATIRWTWTRLTCWASTRCRRRCAGIWPISPTGSPTSTSRPAGGWPAPLGPRSVPALQGRTARGVRTRRRGRRVQLPIQRVTAVTRLNQ